MESISIFDMLKIGIGPSSSHTLGPWRAAQQWIKKIKDDGRFEAIEHIRVDLFGSLSLTGKGHATDVACVLGLSGFDPVTIPIDKIDTEIKQVNDTQLLRFNGEKSIPFSIQQDIVFNQDFLDFHPNGLRFTAYYPDGKKSSEDYYSIGGGFVVQEERKNAKRKEKLFGQFPFPISKGKELLAYCQQENKKISEIVLENERSLRSDEDIDKGIADIWKVMLESIYIGCHTEGTLPGGLNVRRRAYAKHKELIGNAQYTTPEEWIEEIRKTKKKFRSILRWVSSFALAVNEVNASLGRVVTSPTNGAAGVIPAVLMYYQVIENPNANFQDIKQFLLTAGEIGSLFKKMQPFPLQWGGAKQKSGFLLPWQQVRLRNSPEELRNRCSWPQKLQWSIIGAHL